MEDDETIVLYNNKIKNIANESFSLGKVMSNEKLNYCTTLIDDDSEDEEDQEEKVSNFVSFTAQSESPVDDSFLEESEDEDEMIEEDLLEDYKLLCSKWTELTRIYTKVEAEKGRLKEEVEKLLKTVEDRNKKIKGLNVQLQSFRRGLKMMNRSTNILEEILVMEKNAGDSIGIGYKRGMTNNQKGETKFMSSGGNQ
ncbi:hypothetical protein LIER_39715 [Lithospermum erythrorhizon]|uniref:Uncharacterized protein n=1 Tax=Lithospermum erythrorhizon TaxID=34254 RepID=A0AAV3QLD5_LITER